MKLTLTISSRILVLIGLGTVIFVSPTLAQEVLHTFEGTVGQAQNGRGDEIGDLDGDGVPDMAQVESQDHIAFRSGADGSLINMTGFNFDYVGALTVVTGIGDFDGDGGPDIMVGAPSFDAAQALGKVDILRAGSGQMIASFVGTQMGEFLGLKIAEVGDVDGDGYADALFAGRFGSAELHFGPDGSRVRIHPEYADEGAVAGLGDVDGDGHPDYGVGSPNFLVNGLGNAGAFYVFSGLTGALLRKIVGDVPSGFLGRAAAPAGDQDGDGHGDMLIGVSSGNIARIYSGFDGSTLWEYSPPGGLFEHFGKGLAGGKDFTGDGICDWVVGAQQARNPAGDSTGAIYMFDGASGALIWKVYGLEETIGQMGEYVFLSDDMNGDGLAEIGYGDTSADINGLENNGVLTVIAGAPGGASSYCTSNPNSSGLPAMIALEGPVSFGNNELTLKAIDAKPGAFGLFYFGTQPIQVPFGDGIRCVGGITQRLFPPVSIDASGNASRFLDFRQNPVAPGGASPIPPGSTRYFQFWFRDGAGPGGTGFNLTDGMEILFTP